MQRRRMEILKYVRGGLKITGFRYCATVWTTSTSDGATPSQDILQQSVTSALRFLTRWRQSRTRYIHLQPSKPVFLKSHLQMWRHCFMYRISLVTSLRLPLLYKAEWGIFMSQHLAFPVSFIVPPMLHNEHGLRIRCSEWPGQVLDNPEIVIRCPTEETSIFSTGYRSVLAPTQPPTERVKEVLAGSYSDPGVNAEHSSPNIAESENEWNYTFTVPHALVACRSALSLY